MLLVVGCCLFADYCWLWLIARCCLLFVVVGWLLLFGVRYCSLFAVVRCCLLLFVFLMLLGDVARCCCLVFVGWLVSFVVVW